MQKFILYCSLKYPLPTSDRNWELSLFFKIILETLPYHKRWIQSTGKKLGQGEFRDPLSLMSKGEKIGEFFPSMKKGENVGYDRKLAITIFSQK